MMYTNDSENGAADTCHMPGEFHNPVFKGSYSFNTGIVRKLTVQDLAVFVTIIFLTFTFGAYHSWQNRKQETIAEFLLAYRLMTGIPVAISVAASCISGATIIFTFNEVYMFTTMYAYVAIAIILTALTAAHIYHPVFYRLRVKTVTEYLELRFHKIVRTVAAILYLITLLAYHSMNLYAPALALQEVTGLSLWGSIIVMALICITITSLGGLQSVQKADAFQLSVIFLSILVVLGRAIQVTGSWESVWEANKRSNRLVFDEMRWGPGIRHSVWSMVIGSFVIVNSFISTTQLFVQKTVSCSTIKDVKIALYIGLFIYSSFVTLNVVLTLYAGAFYENCDPLMGKLVKSPAEILPLFVMDIHIGTFGLTGLFAAGVLIASLSTNNSGFNAVSTTILEDLILNYRQLNISRFQAKNVARITTVLYGLLVLLGTYAVSKLGSIVQVAYVLFGLTGASLFGVFTLGLFFPWANTQGALSGLIGSQVIMLIVAMMTSSAGYYDKKSLRCTRNCNIDVIGNVTIKDAKMPKTYQLSHMWFGPLVLLFCLFIGLLVSFATGPQDPSDLDRDLYVLVLDDVFPFYHLPESFRERFRHEIRKPKNVINLGTFSSSVVDTRLQVEKSATATESRES